ADLEDCLIRLGDTRDRARATARLLAQEDRGLEPDRTRELESAHSGHHVVGRLVGVQQLGDDPRGSHLVGVEGIDGRFWTVRVARVEELRELRGVARGAIVAVRSRAPDLKPSDRTILEVAGDERAYSAARHRALIPSDRDTYIQMHVRRLEALTREGVVKRTPDGVFHLPETYPDRVRALEGRGGRAIGVVELLDPHPLATQIVYRGPTWLDRLALGDEDRSQLRYEGFGEEVRAAWLKRADTLKALGLGHRDHDGFEAVPDYERALRSMERAHLLQKVERDMGRVAHIARDGDLVQGIFASRLHAAEKSYAVILLDGTATLAPWRPEMDRALNQLVSGRVNGRSFDFTYGREVEKSVEKRLKRGLAVDR
ncbi:MAG: DUF3363 domain-containing protein, partial [Kofleriaceae bacterium]|nr:DUF3363 domain-containing protein [Kofleriaceae bacterium]